METTRATASFRDEHARLIDELAAMESRVAFPPGDEAGRRELMRDFVEFFETHLLPHARWEDENLYPLVDRLMHAEAFHPPFTATMRYEHRILTRWIGEIAAESLKPSPDFRFFTLHALRACGLLRAHFEEEEEVLLAVVDESMTEREFLAEMGGGAHAH